MFLPFSMKNMYLALSMKTHDMTMLELSRVCILPMKSTIEVMSLAKRRNRVKKLYLGSSIWKKKEFYDEGSTLK